MYYGCRHSYIFRLKCFWVLFRDLTFRNARYSREWSEYVKRNYQVNMWRDKTSLLAAEKAREWGGNQWVIRPWTDKRWIQATKESQTKTGGKTTRNSPRCANPDLPFLGVFSFSLVLSNQGNSLVFRVFSAVFLWFSRVFFPGKNYIRLPPSPPFWPDRPFLGREGGGVYISSPPAAGILYAPLFYTPPIPRRVFPGVRGGGFINFGPPFSLGLGSCRAGMAWRTAKSRK